MASGSLKRPILAIRTVSPLVHQVNDNTSHVPPMTMRHNLDLVPRYRSSLRDMELGTGPSLANNGHGWRGMAKTDNIFQHERKERKRNEPTISSKIKDILEWKLGTGVHLERKDNGDHGSAKNTEKAAEGMRDLWKKSRRIESPKNKGPKAGQIYEIVNQHIIEDSMDRTVTISTWREQMDEGHGSDTDSTSIYFISPGGYAPEDAHMLEVSSNFGTQLLGSRHGSRKGVQGTSYGAVGVNNGPSSTTTKVRFIQSPPTSCTVNMTHIQSRANFNGYRQHAQYNDIGSTTTDPSRQKNIAGNKEKHTRSRVKEDDARIKLFEGSLTELSIPDVPFMQRRHHYQESAPIEKELPQPPPFHATRSGATISSIRSVWTSDFERFLDCCNPSLVHVSDILKTLGIYKLEHLKAVARLSPEMRDREVKDVALRLGMTVVEWAILVDKIFQL